MKRYRRYKIRWYVAIRKKNTINDKHKFMTLNNPINGWVADPFLFENGKNTYIFAERWDYLTQKGIICYARYTGKAKVKWIDVIEEKYHMSYPFIWEDDEGIHICAETSAGGKISIYTAQCFPDKWKEDRILIQGQYADSTFYFEEGIPKYLFTYRMSASGGKLLRGSIKNKEITEWRLITCDPQIARPAGAFVTKAGKTYRISQDCSKNYGEAICITEVVRCSESEYEEKFIKSVGYTDISINLKNVIGMHTYNTSNKFEVVDFRCRKFGFLDFLGEKKKQIISILGEGNEKKT